jgi:hypothetical protein
MREVRPLHDFGIFTLPYWRHEAMDGRTDRSRALLERRSSLHPLFIIDSSIRSSVKRSSSSLMVAVHLHHAPVRHDKPHQEVRVCSRKDTFPRHYRGANKPRDFLSYSKSTLLDESCPDCTGSRSELKLRNFRMTFLVRFFVV